MKHNNAGSLMLVLLVALSILSLLLLTSWHSLVQLNLLCKARSTYHCERSLMEGVLNTAISYCLQKREECLNPAFDQQTWHLSYDPWPSPELKDALGHYTATVAISIHDKTWQVAGVLLKEGHEIRRGGCLIRVYKNEVNDQVLRSEIADWTIS